MKSACLRIGTRSSELALFQAHKVSDLLQEQHIDCEIIPIKTLGDVNLIQPIYDLGITGVFTKELDIALLNNQIDIAVHSLKDIPTHLPKNISLSAVLERDYPEDVLLRNPASKQKEYNQLHVGCGSIRRMAFWKLHYPDTQFSPIRGNINTRVRKVLDGEYDATILSLAGLQRLGWEYDVEKLPFMIPAPGQGVIACCSITDNEEVHKALQTIHHPKTSVCIEIERGILKELEAGCSSPIGVYARHIDSGHIEVQAGRVENSQVVSTSQKFDIEKVSSSDIIALLSKELFI